MKSLGRYAVIQCRDEWKEVNEMLQGLMHDLANGIDEASQHPGGRLHLFPIVAPIIRALPNTENSGIVLVPFTQRGKH